MDHSIYIYEDSDKNDGTNTDEMVILPRPIDRLQWQTEEAFFTY